MTEVAAVFTPSAKLHRSASFRAMMHVGDIIKTPLLSTVDMVRVTNEGVTPDAIEALIERGFSRGDTAWIVPARTLTHRRKRNERLTSEESGRWLRAAKLMALANVVLGTPEKARTWLHKPRKAFDGVSAMRLMQTEAGAQLVEEQLNQLDTGFFA